MTSRPKAPEAAETTIIHNSLTMMSPSPSPSPSPSLRFVTALGPDVRLTIDVQRTVRQSPFASWPMWMTRPCERHRQAASLRIDQWAKG
ncbi:hypothetical protein [Streptomyces coelicoflavus]|uniref:hypothetical protein n=1 Tax=Streptomyces coelicoflavus TaxID=285562 RepID=UPI00363577E0